MLDLDIAGKLFPDPLTMAVQLSATAVLLYGFKRLLWVPIQNYLEKRANFLDAELKSAHEANSVARANQMQSEVMLTEAAKEAKQIIENGKLEGSRLKAKLEQQGKNEVDQKLDAALREIEHQKRQLRTDIEGEIVDVALLASAKLLESKIDEEEDRRQIQSFLKRGRN
jgi:F-type H+-transporting ATPase subunit b